MQHENTDGHVELENMPNARDLGYLKTSSGKAILPHKLIRSGALADASDSDLSTLINDYDVHTVIDLRTDDEKEKSPDPQDKMPETTFIDAPILGFSTTGITREKSLKDSVKLLASLKKDPKKLLIDLYPNMLLDEQGMEGYSLFFKTLLENHEGAVLWHCSAGKDRAGLASMLLLYALGVSWDDIVQDYLLTNKYLAEREDDLKKLVPKKFLSESVIESLKVLNSADEDFLNSGVAAVEERYGSIDSYLKDVLGVSDEDKAALQAKYLV